MRATAASPVPLNKKGEGLPHVRTLSSGTTRRRVQRPAVALLPRPLAPSAVGTDRRPAEGGSAVNGPHRRHFAEEVFRDYASRIYRLARQMLGNDADAED